MLPNLVSVKRINVRTCVSLYRQWRETKKGYAGAPTDGLTFNVEYVDTKELAGGTAVPIVLALHGAPGSHLDYESLINHLTSKGVRVIVPNLPAYNVIDSTKYFRHSVHERKSFIMDFLKKINVDKLDMLVTHSGSTYPAISMYADDHFPVKSITMISPGGHRRVKSLKPAWLTDNIARMGLNPLGRAIWRKVGKYILTAAGSQMRLDDPDGVVFSATVLFLAEYERLQGMLEKIRNKRPEFLFIFGGKDKLVEKEALYELSQILGANESHFTKYDAEGNHFVKGSKDEWIRIIEFTQAGHYPFKQYPEIVNVAIEEKLRRVN